MKIYSYIETVYLKSKRSEKQYLDAYLYTYATKEERDVEFIKTYNAALSDDQQDKVLYASDALKDSYQIDVNKDRIIAFELYNQEIQQTKSENLVEYQISLDLTNYTRVAGFEGFDGITETKYCDYAKGKWFYELKTDNCDYTHIQTEKHSYADVKAMYNAEFEHFGSDYEYHVQQKELLEKFFL